MRLKLASFTLQETLIVMIVSTIVVSLAFTVLTLIQRNMWAIQGNLNMNSELHRLEESLWIDANRSGVISFIETENRLIFKSEIDASFYHINKGFITKLTDTFNVQVYSKTFYFNGVESSGNEIDAIKFNFLENSGNRDLFIFKRSDAKQFMN